MATAEHSIIPTNPHCKKTRNAWGCIDCLQYTLEALGYDYTEWVAQAKKCYWIDHAKRKSQKRQDAVRKYEESLSEIPFHKNPECHMSSRWKSCAECLRKALESLGYDWDEYLRKSTANYLKNLTKASRESNPQWWRDWRWKRKWKAYGLEPIPTATKNSYCHSLKAGCPHCLRHTLESLGYDYAAWVKQAQRNARSNYQRNRIKRDPEHFKAVQERWIKNNPEVKKRAGKNWVTTHRQEVVVIAQRRRARKKNVPINDLTAAQWKTIQEHYDHRCVYCGKRRKGKLTQDHVTPYAHNGSNTLWNVVPACRSCNSKKGTGPAPKMIQPILLLPPEREKR